MATTPLLLAFLLLLRLLSLPLLATVSYSSSTTTTTTSSYSTSGTRFDFGTLTLSSLRLLGDAHMENGSIHLTRELDVPSSGAGRALYSRPIRFRHPTTGTPLSFSTFFSFSITNLNPTSIGGGLAFVLASDGHGVGDAGGLLGLINATAGTDDSSSVFVAVEFDTLMDVEFGDINGNHVGLDLNTVVSTEATDLGASANVDLKSGDLVSSWVDYDGPSQLLRVFVSYSTSRPNKPTLSLPLDLSRFVDDHMYVGFSASTQASTETHTVEWWSFASSGNSASSTPIAAPPSPSITPHATGTPPPPPLGPAISVSVSADPNNTDTNPTTSSTWQRRPAAVAGLAIASAFAFVGLAGLVLYGLSLRKRRSSSPSQTLGVEVVRAPREFTYRELSVATRRFDLNRVIGHGAFGTVYRGVDSVTGEPIAVKRCMKGGGSSGGRADFLSELSIIAGLRHRNLVRLQGWCHEKGEILLVYDHMPNGSLDRALFENTSAVLTWRQRRRVLSGVAAALAYLHGECERQVIHRDVKSSNVLLDEGYHARLGDFGLARQVDHGGSPEATAAAGTMGYLAPEYLLTGRATEKTDVFSFGALVLEVVCGRRPIEGGGGGGNLVEWVWRLYGQGRELEAVDPRVSCVGGGGGYDVGEARRVVAVGLACSHPDAVARPCMRVVVQMLGGEADMPAVPRARPTAAFGAPTQHLLLSLQDSASDIDDGLASVSSSSSNTPSLGGVGPSRRQHDLLQ